MGVLADLRGDDGTKLGVRYDVVEIVDIHDCRCGSASHLEEFKGPIPSLFQTH